MQVEPVDELRRSLLEKFERIIEVRARGVGLRLFLDFAQEAGALTAMEAEDRWQEGWEALASRGR